MEERTILCKNVRQGFVEFANLQSVLSVLIELWSSIRPFIRCTGNPEAKNKAERVSPGFVFVCACCDNFVRCSFVVMFLS